jgi:transcriptional regulator with XRE-family HTH domain
LNIKKRRAGSGLSQAKLARRVGVTRSHLANVENGRRSLTDALKQKIVRVLSKGA